MPDQGHALGQRLIGADHPVKPPQVIVAVAVALGQRHRRGGALQDGAALRARQRLHGAGHAHGRQLGGLAGLRAEAGAPQQPVGLLGAERPRILRHGAGVRRRRRRRGRRRDRLDRLGAAHPDAQAVLDPQLRMAVAPAPGLGIPVPAVLGQQPVPAAFLVLVPALLRVMNLGRLGLGLGRLPEQGHRRTLGARRGRDPPLAP